MELKPGMRLTVFNIKTRQKGGTTWSRAGTAWINRDCSINLYLDVLPLDGTLHMREAVERKETLEPTAEAFNEQPASPAPMGGH